MLSEHLPKEKEQLDQLLLRIMGGPDPKQIDGLGGASSVTSKVAILAPSPRKDADIAYTFAQVVIGMAQVSYAGNCGNILSGVGPYALESGLVAAQDPVTTVRIINTNTNKIIEEEVQTPGGAVRYDGDYAIAGVPGTGAPVKITIPNPSGSVLQGLLPTGNVVDKLPVPELGMIEVSVVDAANPVVFVRAEEVGLTGRETPEDIDRDAALLERLEMVRGEAARMLGLVVDAGQSALVTPGVPKLHIVSPPASYTTSSGDHVDAQHTDLLVRAMSMQRVHPTCGLTGCMCTGAAAVIPGTVVHRSVRKKADPDRLRIGHPAGVMEVGVAYGVNKGSVEILSVSGYRTARLLMRGEVYC